MSSPRRNNDHRESNSSDHEMIQQINSSANNVNYETSDDSRQSGFVGAVRRLTRTAAKVWSEITSSQGDDEARPALVVNPRHHLRSHSIGGSENNSIASAFAEAAATVLGADNPSNTLSEPLLMDTSMELVPGDDNLGDERQQAEVTILSPCPPPPPRGLRQRTSSGAFLTASTRRKAREFVRRAGNYLAYFILFTMLCVVPMVVYHGLKDRRVDSAAFRSAGVMACGTIIMSVRLVYLHLTHWYMPGVQKYVVRILWMVPLYAVQSCLSLRFHDSRIYIDTLRDYYEAYVICSFVYYLIELLGGEAALIQILTAKRTTNPDLGKHPFPLRLILDDWTLGEDFKDQCKHGVLQYVVFKSIAAFVTFMCEMTGTYGEGKFSWFVAFPYLCFFQNISVMYALYCLVKLFSAVNEELRYPINWRPLGKFLCIKGVVFFTWWQGVVIYYLKAHGLFDHAGSWSSEEVANGLIDYCVVIEMVGFAIAHSYTFTYKEYLPENIPAEFRNMTAAHSGADHEIDSDEAPPPSHLNAPHNAILSDLEHASQGVVETGPLIIPGGEHEDLSPSSPMNMGQRKTAYHPPATLDQPMDFRDAFWSSTVPNETINDIQKLRIGKVVLERPGLSMRGRQNNEEDIENGATSKISEGSEEEHKSNSITTNEADQQKAGSSDSCSGDPPTSSSEGEGA